MKPILPADQKKKSPHPLEKIRPELNLEKWSIWQPSHSTSVKTSRTFERSFIREGKPVNEKVTVDYNARLGDLTTKDQKTYYALVKIWEGKDRPPQAVIFNLRELAKALHISWAGSKTVEAIKDSLLRLRSTFFIWENSFFDSETNEPIKLLDSFQILSDFKLAQRTRTEDGKKIEIAIGYFEFHKQLLNNLIHNHTKPLLFDVIISFKSEIAQLLYTRIDLILAESIFYERRTKELFLEDLGLDAKIYEKPSERKRKLEKALKELQGLPLSSGALIFASIEETKDGKDYKVVFRKRPRPPQLPFPEPAEQGRGDYQEPDKDQPTIQAEELVRHFYQLFHNVETPYPTTRAINQAISLIAQYGIDQAKYIVEFSKKAAQETNYNPQTFGGILQYTSRALADLECARQHQSSLAAHQAEEEARQQAEEESRRQYEAASIQAEAYLAQMPEADQQALFVQARADLLKQFSWLARQSPQAQESTIKRKVIKGLVAKLVPTAPAQPLVSSAPNEPEQGIETDPNPQLVIQSDKSDNATTETSNDPLP